MSDVETDIVVLGAGPAGAAAALDLARAGRRVLVLDRHDFPRAKPCAGGVTIKAVQRLRYDPLPVVRTTVDHLQMSLYGYRRTDFRADAPVALMTHRPELDELALDQARRAGAEFRVVGPLGDLRQNGQEVRLRCGSLSIRAQWLIAADGAHSTARRLVFGSRGYPGAVAIEGLAAREDCARFPPTGFDFGVIRGGYGWVFPKGDHVNVGLYVARQGHARPGRTALHDYAAVRLGTSRLDCVQGFPVATRGHRGPVATDRVLFAGDAAGLAEPLLGEGIYAAILSGQYAAAAVLHDRTVQECYTRSLAAWREELRRTHWLALGWYHSLPLAFGALRHGAGKAMMDGFAGGLTTGQIKRALLSSGSGLRPGPAGRPAR